MRGRPTGNPQFSEEEQRAYDLYQAQNSAALSSSSSESDESPPSPYQPQYGYGNSGYSPYHDGAGLGSGKQLGSGKSSGGSGKSSGGLSNSSGGSGKSSGIHSRW